MLLAGAGELVRVWESVAPTHARQRSKERANPPQEGADMMDVQTLTLVSSACVLAVAAWRARMDERRARGSSWTLTDQGRAELVEGGRPRPRRTAAQAAQRAADELVLAIQAGLDAEAAAWTVKLTRLARSAQATASRRGRYQRARAGA